MDFVGNQKDRHQLLEDLLVPENHNDQFWVCIQDIALESAR